MTAVMPTNDVFYHLCRLTGVYKNKELIMQLFLSQGFFDISKAKIKAWNTKDRESAGYRQMPKKALDTFISALYERYHQECEEIDVGSIKGETGKLPTIPISQKDHAGKRARRHNTTGIKRLSLGHTKNASGYRLLRYVVNIPASNGEPKKTKSFYFGENKRQEEAFLDAVEFLRKNGQFPGTNDDAMGIYRMYNHGLMR